MKYSLVLILLVALVTQSHCKILEKKEKKESKPATNILTGDFLTGFETGIFLKNSKDQVDEYGCPKAAIKIEEFRKVKDLLPNVA